MVATIRTALLAAFFVALPFGLAGADDGANPAAGEALPERYRDWLESVAPLTTELERETFLSIEEDYQRDHFIRRFWKTRDPFPQTVINELRGLWEPRVEVARKRYGSLDSEPARTVLTLGEPTRRERLTCAEMLEPLEVWAYEEGSDRIGGYFTLVFTGFAGRDGEGADRQHLWRPTEGLRRLVTFVRPGTSTTDDRELALAILKNCTRGDDILASVSQALDMGAVEKTILPPVPDEEWVLAFKARSTDVPEDALPLPASFSLSFPGRHQNRTVVQGLVVVPRSAATAAEEKSIYHFVVDGEILRRGKLFDTFRYRFDLPGGRVDDDLPLVLQRYLRPGEYELIVKVTDVHSKRVFRETRELEVPVYKAPRRPRDAAVATKDSEPGAAAVASSGADEKQALETRLLEANASISTGDHVIEIAPPPDELLVGKLRVLARARGEGIARVAFELDGQMQMRKANPPYSVELDLGDKPRLQTLRAFALDEAGEILASDEVLLNGGPQRFAVRLLAPQPGKRYTESVRAHAEVEIPEGERLDRLELFVNETLLATLYQPPFEQPLYLDEMKDGELTYVRAVAYLPDGSSAEDAVFINAPDFVDNFKVNFVELYTTVIDKKGDFVEDLASEEVTVLEDGVEQKIRRFEKVRDLSIRAGLLIDTSTSMARSLRDVRRAAHRFLQEVLTPKDRAAVITFNDAPKLDARFTSDVEVLAGGLSGLVAEGETALYDSILFSLHYLSGGRGKRALIVLTDGEDSTSTYTFDDTLNFARHTGVAIYVIGLGLPSDLQSRSLMKQLAKETGGGTFFIDGVHQLERVYNDIQHELRSQYLLAYQSSAAGGGEFRTVEVKVGRKGVEAKTLNGYFP